MKILAAIQVLSGRRGVNFRPYRSSSRRLMYRGAFTKLTTGKAYGFQTFRATAVAAYHTLGALPEPERPPKIQVRRRHSIRSRYQIQDSRQAALHGSSR
jgi:hypothetical protein